MCLSSLLPISICTAGNLSNFPKDITQFMYIFDVYINQLFINVKHLRFSPNRNLWLIWDVITGSLIWADHIIGQAIEIWDIINYPLFADADKGIHPHTAWKYHTRLKAKRGIAMLSVDKSPYPRQQTTGNDFIPCSNDVCHFLKRFRRFKTPAVPFILPKSSYLNSVLLGTIPAARKVDGGRDRSVIAIVTSSMTFLSL